MVCPSLEKQRKDAKAKRAEKAKAKRAADRAKAAAKFTTSDGYDVRTLMHAIQNLKAWEEEGGAVARAVGRVTVAELEDWHVWPKYSRIFAEVSLLSHMTDTASAVLKPSVAADPSNRVAIAIAAAGEYFDIPRHEIREVWRVGKRLALPGERFNRTVWWGIEQAAEAKRKAEK